MNGEPTPHSPRDLVEQIEQRRRDDPEFVQRIGRRVKEDAPVLDRLDDGPTPSPSDT